MNFDELMARAAENVLASKKTQPIKRYDTTVTPPKKEVRPKGISPNVLAFLAKMEEEKRKKADEQKYLETSTKRYRKKPNIIEMLKAENEKTKTDEEIAHVNSASDKTAEAANTRFIEANKKSSYEPETEQEKVDTSKKKRQGNAPTYTELLKMAAEASCQGTVANTRPMTAKEKEERERQTAYKKTDEYRIWNEYGPATLEKYKAAQKTPKDNEVQPISKNDKQKQFGAKKTATKRTYDGKPVLQKIDTNSGANRSQTMKNGKENETRPEPTSSDLKIAAQTRKNEFCKEKVANIRPVTAKENKELERQTTLKKIKEYRILNDYGPAALETYRAQQFLKEKEVEPISKNYQQKQVGAKKTAIKCTCHGKPVIQKMGANSGANRSQTLKNGKENETRPEPTSSEENEKRLMEPAKKRAKDGNPLLQKLDANSADNRVETLKNGKENEKRPEPAEEKQAYSSVNETLLVCRPARMDRPGPQNSNIRDHFNVDESEDSDDDEDDFIDDMSLQNDSYSNNISRHIRAIFGYDKREFRDFDDKDDRSMETSYRDQMKEEAKSARLGKKEDLEDIRREKEELKRAQAKKMRR